MDNTDEKQVSDFLNGKSEHTLKLFNYFVDEYNKIGAITLQVAKTMIGVDNGHKRIAWITQLGKNFIHIVFPFKHEYPDNLCFQKIARVPGDARQFNHHFRMYTTEDVNEEVLQYMLMAFVGE